MFLILWRTTAGQKVGHFPSRARSTFSGVIGRSAIRTPHASKTAFAVGPLLTFSFEFDGETFERLAQLGVPLDFFLYGTSSDRPMRFGSEKGPCYSCKVSRGREGPFVEAAHPTDVNDLVRQLRERLVPLEEGAEGESEQLIRLSFMLERMTGFFRLEPESVRALAALGSRIIFGFYNAGD